jgi:hypothetical protein
MSEEKASFVVLGLSAVFWIIAAGSSRKEHMVAKQDREERDSSWGFAFIVITFVLFLLLCIMPILG